MKLNPAPKDVLTVLVQAEGVRPLWSPWGLNSHMATVRACDRAAHRLGWSLASLWGDYCTKTGRAAAQLVLHRGGNL